MTMTDEKQLQEDEMKRDEEGNPLDAVPSLEMLFVQAVSSALEVASMLGMTQELFCSTMKAAWKIDDKRRQKERELKAKETVKP